MIHIDGKYLGNLPTEDGYILNICVNCDKQEISDLGKLQGTDVTITIEPFSEHKSVQANKMFWRMATLIGNAIGVDKDTTYIRQLRKYGVYEVRTFMSLVLDVALPVLQDEFRYIEEHERYYEMLCDADGNPYKAEYVMFLCYKGLSKYTQTEISKLIDGCMEDANDLGIKIWTDAEVENLLQGWGQK